jgi:hypothetical protein
MSHFTEGSLRCCFLFDTGSMYMLIKSPHFESFFSSELLDKSLTPSRRPAIFI